MAPSRRSSTPSTPTAKTTSDTNTLLTPQSIPRKAPHCTKCHRPRAGHPRQGCPFVDAPGNTVKGTENITKALESLHLEPQDAIVTPQRRLRRSSVKPPSITAPEASLASLNMDSSEILNRLLQPGIMDNNVEEDEEEKRATVAKWQQTMTPVATPTKRGKSRMPGTLITPSTTKASLDPDGFIATQSSVQSKVEEPKPTVRMPGTLFSTSKITMEPTALDFDTPEEPSPSHTSSASSKHLMRSMSVEERDEFLNSLVKTSRSPPATAFVLPVGEILTAQLSASKLGFHTRVYEQHDLKKSGEGWLFIGMDRQAVEDLFISVESGAKKNVGGVGFKAVASGVVAGAVATWTGLAFA